MKLLIINLLLLFINIQIWCQVQLVNFGSTIPGESNLNGYSAYTEVFDVSFNTNYQNKARPGLFSFRKIISKTTPLIAKEMYNRKTINTIDVAILKQGGNGQKYCSYKFKECVILSVRNISDTIEEIEILPSQFYIEYRPQLISGTYGPYISYGWNFGANVFWDGL